MSQMRLWLKSRMVVIGNRLMIRVNGRIQRVRSHVIDMHILHGLRWLIRLCIILMNVNLHRRSAVPAGKRRKYREVKLLQITSAQVKFQIHWFTTCSMPRSIFQSKRSVAVTLYRETLNTVNTLVTTAYNFAMVILHIRRRITTPFSFPTLRQWMVVLPWRTWLL